MPQREPLRHRYPAALIQSRKEVADRHADAVRLALRAMKLRGVPRHQITVKAVVQESCVSAATVYRRDDLFGMIVRANPTVARRTVGSSHRDEIAHLRAERDTAVAEARQYREEAHLLRLGQRREQVELQRDRKALLRLQQEVQGLRERLAQCRCTDDGPG